jgi:dihydrofolate reductase
MTVDGVFEDPGGSEGFALGGWAFRFDRGPQGDKFKLDEAMASAALLLGRVTYEGFAAAWPSMTGPFAEKFNSMPKYVVSATLDRAEWNNTTVIDGDVVGAVAELKQHRDGDILVNGSAQLVRTLIDAKLVDELRLMLYPVVLGRGRRLFSNGIDETALRLVDAKLVSDCMVLIYVPADR